MQHRNEADFVGVGVGVDVGVGVVVEGTQLYKDRSNN